MIFEIEMDNDTFLPIAGDELSRMLQRITHSVDGCPLSQCEGICHVA